MTVEKKQNFGIMYKNFDTPTRMCIICKNRFRQKDLYRYQVKDEKIIPFSKHGRSFYLCLSCIDGNEKRLMGVLKNRYKLNLQMDSCSKILKEIATNG